jgi:tetratricopeptide (TPR) repeat protein
MLRVGMNKSEIEKELEGKGPFIQIDWLNRFLKEPLTTDMKKFIFTKLANLYEKTKMFSEAAKCYNNLAQLSLTFAERIKFYLKEAEFYIYSGSFSKADEAVRKAVTEANTLERKQIQRQILEIYKKQAENYEKEGKRAKAAETYEKLIEISTMPSEREEFKKKLLSLYEKLGKLRESKDLEAKFMKK